MKKTPKKLKELRPNFSENFFLYLQTLEGMKVSILLDGLNGKESYTGILSMAGKDYIEIDLDPNETQKKKYNVFVIPSKNVLSLLIYTDTEYH